eukprot:SAG22_NODE_112_length_19423_cov_11.462223_3_plen_97_part_00
MSTHPQYQYAQLYIQYQYVHLYIQYYISVLEFRHAQDSHPRRSIDRVAFTPYSQFIRYMETSDVHNYKFICVHMKFSIFHYDILLLKGNLLVIVYH